jgi:hypothetical protein
MVNTPHAVSRLPVYFFYKKGWLSKPKAIFPRAYQAEEV